MSSVGSYVAGVALAIISTVINASGLLLQKLVHMRREAAKNNPSKTPPPALIKEVLWLGGLGCLVVGALLSLAVFALLGQARSSAMVRL